MMMWMITVKEIVETKKWSGERPAEAPLGSPPIDYRVLEQVRYILDSKKGDPSMIEGKDDPFPEDPV